VKFWLFLLEIDFSRLSDKCFRLS